MKKNMAICFSGLHYIENMEHWSKMKSNIHYKQYENNIKTKIYKFFERDYEIDTFFCTNSSIMIDDLCKTYNPIKYSIENDLGGNFKKRKVLELLLDFINETNKNYDTILLTRFDIYILEQFTNQNIKLNSLNIVSELEHSAVCDDNLFIFPTEYLVKIIGLMKNINLKNACAIHLLKHEFHKHFEINYICNEPGKLVRDLSFFKLRFFLNREFILNKYIFSDNVVYKSFHNSSDFIINENIITFNKKTYEIAPMCWIGYQMKKQGSYHLTFEILSNKNITNYDFIKLHKPIIFYKTPNILENTWTKVDIMIKINELDDLLCLIFDNYKDKIEIRYKNICFTQI
jgi:hypothetical protein